MWYRTHTFCTVLAVLAVVGWSSWHIDSGSTFAKSTSPKSLASPQTKNGLQAGQAYAIEFPSAFEQPESALEITNLPDVYFDLPAGEQNFQLVLGCVQGELVGNSFELEVVSKQESPEGASSLPFQGRAKFIPLPPLLIPRNTTHNANLFLTGAARNPGFGSPDRFKFDLTTERILRTFYLYGGEGDFLDQQSYQQCPTRLLAESTHLRIWYDTRDESEVTNDDQIQHRHQQAEHLASVFEQLIVPRLIPWLGEVSDLDRDGKFSIVLSSQLNEISKGKEPLVGLTWSGDYRRNLPAPLGNSSDVVYLNSSSADLKLLTEVLVHEYVHALSFDLHLEASSSPQYSRSEDDWLNEGLAHVVETQLTGTQFNIHDRLREFNSRPELYPLVVPNYSRSGLWRSPGCRGATFSFLRWCIDQRDLQLVPDLIHAENAGMPNMVQKMGQPFADLFRGWSISLSQESTSNLTMQQGDTLHWLQAVTASRSFLIHQRAEERLRVRIKNESESGMQLTLIPLSDPKAEEALLN
ncbi:hypothetical protein Pla110_38220 [Polystyrenella longa]|uniref:Neutral metalloprotease n=1 Tax=Polystyrenella longa TaxID=2528007 RepID=A0A518CS54_9PLAN|nr:hypothetical protein [Polystyrenella longa]QDU82067.1 hypothetical protein Pla110_38220 [Polystyrenella longa]